LLDVYDYLGTGRCGTGNWRMRASRAAADHALIQASALARRRPISWRCWCGASACFTGLPVAVPSGGIAQESSSPRPGSMAPEIRQTGGFTASVRGKAWLAVAARVQGVLADSQNDVFRDQMTALSLLAGSSPRKETPRMSNVKLVLALDECAATPIIAISGMTAEDGACVIGAAVGPCYFLPATEGRQALSQRVVMARK